MSLLSNIRQLLKEYIKNPVVIAGVAFIIYMILKRYLPKKENAYPESINVKSRLSGGVIIHDSKTNKYIYIDNETHDIYSADTEQALERKFAR